MEDGQPFDPYAPTHTKEILKQFLRDNDKTIIIKTKTTLPELRHMANQQLLASPPTTKKSGSSRPRRQCTLSPEQKPRAPTTGSKVPEIEALPKRSIPKGSEDKASKSLAKEIHMKKALTVLAKVDQPDDPSPETAGSGSWPLVNGLALSESKNPTARAIKPIPLIKRNAPTAPNEDPQSCFIRKKPFRFNIPDQNSAQNETASHRKAFESLFPRPATVRLPGPGRGLIAEHAVASEKIDGPKLVAPKQVHEIVLPEQAGSSMDLKPAHLNDLAEQLTSFISAGNEFLRSANDALAKLQEYQMTNSRNAPLSTPVAPVSASMPEKDPQPSIVEFISSLVPPASPTFSDYVLVDWHASFAHGGQSDSPDKTQHAAVSREMIQKPATCGTLIRHSFKGMYPPRLEMAFDLRDVIISAETHVIKPLPDVLSAASLLGRRWMKHFTAVPLELVPWSPAPNTDQTFLSPLPRPLEVIHSSLVTWMIGVPVKSGLDFHAFIDTSQHCLELETATPKGIPLNFAPSTEGMIGPAEFETVPLHDSDHFSSCCESSPECLSIDSPTPSLQLLPMEEPLLTFGDSLAVSNSLEDALHEAMSG